MSGYDEYDRLVDTDPLTLRDRCRAAEHELADLRASIEAEIDVFESVSGTWDAAGVAGILRALLVQE
jgi:hypothetical protein